MVEGVREIVERGEKVKREEEREMGGVREGED